MKYCARVEASTASAVGTAPALHRLRSDYDNAGWLLTICEDVVRVSSFVTPNDPPGHSSRMRTLKQLSYLGTATLLTASAGLLAGCGSSFGPDGAGGVGATTGTGANPGTGSVTGAGGGAGAVPGTGGVGGELPTGPCTPGIAVTSQIPRLLNKQYDNIVRDLLGVTALENGQAPSSLLNSDDPGAMNKNNWGAYLHAAEVIAAQVMGGPNRSMFIECDPAAAGCLTETYTKFGRKAFRRPMNADDLARFEALSATTPAGEPEEVAETALQAFLVSPSFLQANEFADTTEGAFYKLNSYEVAMRLSLTLWGSVPDEELNAAADADMLQTPEQIFAQALRMLGERDKSAAQVVKLHRHYARMDDDLSHWFSVRPSPEKFPLYSPQADAAMAAELDAFFEEVAFSGGSFKDLFLSPVGFVNQDTAPLYGLEAGSYGAELAKVDLDPTERPGFLTRVGFLSSYTHAEATSPILRGAFIAQDIINAQIGAPDPDALKTPPPEGVFLTERDYVTELTKPAECLGCHHLAINPPGFVLENYDAVGSWQTTDPRGGPIDPVVTMPIDSTEQFTLTNAKDLMDRIAVASSARRHYAEKIVSAATGRLPNAYDACIVDDLNDKLAGEGYGILDLFADITQADSFRLRQQGN